MRIATIEELLQRYNAERSCVGVVAADVNVLALEHPTAATRKRVLDTAGALIRDQRAEAITMGCAGMSTLHAEMSRTLGVPVIDGVATAVRLLESLLALGLATSKLGTYAPSTGRTQ